MRFHVVASAVVLVLSLLVGVSKLELAILVLVIMAVFVSEMFNTALEFAVDLVTSEYHPLAKVAKDVSAGAVLVTSVAALAVGYLLLSDNLGPFSLETLEHVRNWPGHVTLVALVLVAIAVLLGKALTRAPNNFLGGMPSGHAAVSFAGWVAASFVASEGRFAGLVSLITLLMALLVCQSRVEAGIHTYYEVTAWRAPRHPPRRCCLPASYSPPSYTIGLVDLSSVIEAARVASLKAYAPYSNFRVGAAILTGSGDVRGVATSRTPPTGSRSAPSATLSPGWSPPTRTTAR
jgi:diacylglycerol kinase (ATP)